MTIGHRWKLECLGPDGKQKWLEEFDNLVTDAGLNKYLDATLKTGLASPLWYVGLVAGPNELDYAAGDTMASHAGWTESTVYSNATRPQWVSGAIAAGSIDNSASPANFAVNGAATVSGAFLADNSTKGGTTGTLLCVGAFSLGDKVLGNGDTLLVTVTPTIARA